MYVTWICVLFATALKQPEGGSAQYSVFLSRFGGHSVSKTPGSIPNPAVKCHSADGTAS
jgi:hypothetical protein